MKLISFDRGFWKDEAGGQQFNGVFILSVEAGWLYELNGRWLDENESSRHCRKETGLALALVTCLFVREWWVRQSAITGLESIRWLSPRA